MCYPERCTYEELGAFPEGPIGIGGNRDFMTDFCKSDISPVYNLRIWSIRVHRNTISTDFVSRKGKNRDAI